MSDNIKVVVKVRPLISREIEDKSSYQWRVKNNTLYQIDQNGRDIGQAFTFDKVYDKDTKTRDVYKDIAKPIVDAATAGINGTIFAYGQTSSGKTYTMAGTEESPGIIPLAVLNLFETIKNIPDRDFLVRVSYIEIYNETLKDLLNVEKDNIKIHETFEGIKVDVTEKVTSSPEEVLEVMKEGEANRQTGATNMNEKSSRSHSIFQITIESREHIEGEEEVGCVNVSQLNLVDLAGSERSGQTGATGIRFKEGTHINKSLSSLALVIKQLSEDPNKYANYRDSKLTRILQNSLGGNAKTSIICAVTPAAIEETISTLQFANRAKAIKNTPEVNAVATDATMIQSLTKQLSKLQAQLESKKTLEVILESKKNVEQDNYNLQKQIAALQKLILNGFGQRPTVGTGAGRRKQPLRRITISTLHAIEEHPAPPVPRFCTPALKYNPMALASASDFVPIQNANSLASLPEEPLRLVTPPPNEKRVNFSDEVIELDSDDDDSLNVKTCSPYHKCYVSSKTPPCILRKNAKQAEKNLKDIVELTEREKIYTPSVVEFIEKLEHNTTVIAKLQDEVDSLHRLCKEKDFEMDHFQNKIKKAEEQLQNITSAKIALETQCNDYSIKVTDWEVSYDTLKKKFKLREEELLSLLDENKMKKPEGSGKLIQMTGDKQLSHLIDKSKDVSLVSSDNESSITHQDKPSTQIASVVSDLNAQLTLKNQIILELETEICAHKQRIDVLENSNQELHDMINNFKCKLTNVDDENSLLKSTIDTLNFTIKSQKSNLETARNDMESYNGVIQQLQIQLTHKENILNMNISDSVLESMIANEEKFIANNENIKNIIHSFKIALENRNEEINQLKTTKDSDPNVDTLLKDLHTKEQEIESLNKDIHKLDDQAKENIAMINKLVREKNNLTSVELDLTQKLVEAEDHYKRLENENKKIMTQIETLKESNVKMTSEISNRNINEQNNLVEQISRMESKIAELEKDNNLKNDLIISFGKEEKQSQENLLKAKSAMIKLQDILVLLGGNIQEYPEVIENFVNVFKVLTNNLITLESIVVDIISEKQQAINDNIELKKQLSELVTDQNSEINVLKSQIEILLKSENNLSLENTKLNQELNKLVNELTETRNELDLKVTKNDNLETMLIASKKKNEALQIEILAQGETIMSLQNIEAKLSSEKQELLMESKEVEHSFKQDIELLSSSVTSKQERLDEILQEHENNIAVLENTLKEKCYEMKILTETLNDVCMKRDQVMEGILKKLSHLTDSFNVTNSATYKFEQQDIDMKYNVIVLSLDKIANHINLLDPENIDREQNHLEAVFLEAKEQIGELTQQNIELLSKVSQIEEKNQKLFDEIEKIQSDNKSLNGNLSDAHELLKKVQLELKIKCEEFASMEFKVREWKDQFNNLDTSMKQQVQKLREENDNLKVRVIEMQEMTSDQISRFDGLDLDDFEMYNVKKYTNENIVQAKYSPKSLVTICCSNILDHIQPKEKSTTNVSPCSSNSDIEVKNAITQTNTCCCDQLSSELLLSQQENSDLISIVEQLKFVNEYLIEEREEVRNEIQLLTGPTYELQKKLENHRTNLSILTATTYAENKSLHSQVKGLQHHHTRFHNVCQRDIPAFKKQLCELMTMLNGEVDPQNTSFKRYSLPDVLDNNNTLKNESTLDADLLMMDTNVTLTTTGDNTLVACDQTCLDLTQTLFNEASCQTTELNQTIESHVIYPQMELLNTDNRNMFEKLEVLKEENRKLRELVDRFSDVRDSDVDERNPNKTESAVKPDHSCEKCRNIEELHSTLLNLRNESYNLSQELAHTMAQKTDIEQKYDNLKLEIPSSDALVRKLSVLEKDYSIKMNEFAILNGALSKKNQQIKSLQEENDTLSTQVMENISEADELNKELGKLQQVNLQLADKCSDLEKQVKESKEVNFANSGCCQCILKDKIIQSIRGTDFSESHSKLNRSYSDSDTSSRYNKICTLQSELHAGREDCKELTEEVTTIKEHFERSNISMDLDESMSDSNVFTYTKDMPRSPQSTTCSMPDIPEERPLDIYMLDKIDCLNYYMEKTSGTKENLNYDVKIIDVMRMLYDNLIVKHNNEVENLVNKLTDYEESKNNLQTRLDSVTAECTKTTKELKERCDNIKIANDIISKLKQNINSLNNEMTNVVEVDNNTKLIRIFKENLLKILDTGFGLSSMNIFDLLIDKVTSKHQKELNVIMNRNSELQEDMERVTEELTSVNNTVSQMKRQLADKESEFNLLKAQKEKIHEISKAVTLDIIKKEKELNETITNGCEKLLKLKIVNPGDIDVTLPLNKTIALLIDHFINLHTTEVRPDLEKEKNKLKLEIESSKLVIAVKEEELRELNNQYERIQQINDNLNHELVEKENKIQSSIVLNDDLNKLYNSKVEENNANLILIEKLTEEIKLLKENIVQNEASIQKLSEKDDKVKAFADKVKVLNDENERLKSINEMIIKEKDAYACELEKSAETIRRNNAELDKMTSDILILRESVKEHSSIVEALKTEAKSLVNQNLTLKEHFEEKCRLCTTLETNIKTHEKTAEIQSRMINRLQKLKDEDDKTLNAKETRLEELSAKYTEVLKEYEHLKTVNASLEARVLETECALENLNKRRSSMDAISDSSRRRRQSLHDSKRLFSDDKHDLEDSCNLSAVFESGHKSVELSMDLSDNPSNRSSPVRLSKGRDSVLSRTDQRWREGEGGSRGKGTRRRRQSCHDLHRSVSRDTSTPDDYPKTTLHDSEDTNDVKRPDSGGADSEVSQLRERLKCCQLDLEDLKEKYRELDEECETCAEYLRERDDQCRRLKKEKSHLEHLVTDLRSKLESPTQTSESKRHFANVSVNTDEDWTNLHAVVVDRMSYDAEVEKNKRLTKTIEELRFKKQDLKNNVARMQKIMEKHSGKDNRELEATKFELQQCKDELEDLRVKFKELDEECETCAEYLRERDEQCRKLKEAKSALEVKLREYQEEGGALTRTLSLRKKRRTAHDLNRTAHAHAHAGTDTSDDFLSYQVERDDSSQPAVEQTPSKKINSLKATVDKLTQQKMALEDQLLSSSKMSTPHPTMYVATGSAIVQNQQLSDVMKENQKLKKINAKLVNICKKRGKSGANRENEDPSDQG